MLRTIITSILVATISAVALFLVYIFGSTHLRNTAIDGCAHASRNIYNEEGDKFTRSIEETDKNAYEACLILKRVK